MAEQEYRVRLTADTKQATDKLDAVQNTISGLTAKSHDIKVNVDANAFKRAANDTQEIANSIRSTKLDLKEASGVSIISGNTLGAAATLAGQFYGIRRDIRGIESDLGRALGKTNVSEFMRTEQFLDRVLDNSRNRTREIVDTYKNIREVPGAADLLGPVENFARSKAWEQFGSQIADQTLKGVQAGLQQSVVETKKFFYADLLDDVGASVSRTIDTLARLGLAIQGVQLLIGPLAATWSAAFDAIIGQNVRLEQTILSTQTTLASTGRIFSTTTGEELKDPLQKIQALEGSVSNAIENIRVRSLDLAGVTSQQIIEIFGVVATSIGQVNGSIKDAEDLAISFTAALGTLGIPFYQARQEIGSILGGYITEDSLLAKRLQISNKDIEQAKNNIDGVVGYLQKKLETAVAGQAIQAQGFTGVLSNIQEVFEVIGQRIGAPLLKPLVAGLTGVYEFLKKIQGIVSEVGQYIATVLAKTITDITSIFANSNLVESIGSFIQSLAAPYEQLSRAVELGLGGRGTNLLEAWLRGTERVPVVMQGVVNALRAFGTFLKLQIELVVEPIVRLLDMTRERLGGLKGMVQSVARAPQFVFFEGTDAFTKGWDTVASTIQYAASSLSKFGLAVAKLKLTELTAGIRAAAGVFELFGSLVLGKLNLAISFFDFLGNVASSDIAKFLVAMLAINKVVNNTEFFGLKGLVVWLTQLRPIVQQLTGDIKLFAQGFKDAGNINALMANAQGTYARVFAAQGKSSNPVLQNAAAIENLTQRLASLNAMQSQMAAQGAGAAAMQRYSKAIVDANESLAQLKKTEQSFTATQRASAAVKSLFGGGAEVAQAKEAARQAAVMASGAASAQALSGAMEALRVKLGMTKEQFNSLGGAAQAAGKSLQTFLTTTALINIGFTVAALGISALIARYQQLEEQEKKVSVARKNMIAVNGVLASGYASIIKAAEGGDIAAQRLLETQREIAQAQLNTDQSDLTELKNKYSELNDQLYKYKAEALALAQEQSKYLRSGRWWDTPFIQNITKASILTADIADKEAQIAKNKKNQALAEQQIFKARQALAKLAQEEQQVKDFNVIAERRKDLEDRIARAREDYTKEVTDKEFQSRMEYLSLEQQKRREMVEMEKAAMAQRYQMLIANSGEQEAKVLQIAQEYSAALLDAVASEEQRRAELMQKQMQLQKEIDDYAFRMAREKINLEKQLGGYKKQIEQYMNQQQELRIKKEIASLKSRAALQGSSYQPYNLAQQQSFMNATQQAGREIDHRIAYAMLQVVPKQQLGLSGLESGEVVVEKLRQALGNLPVTMESLKKLIQQFTSGVGDPSVLATKLIKDAELAFNSSRFITPQNTADLEIPNLEIDWAGLQARIKQAADQVLGMFVEYQQAQAAKSKQQLDLLIKRAQDPSGFTNIKADYTSELERGKVSVENFVIRLTDWSKGISTATAEINAINQQFEAEVRALVRDFTTKYPGASAVYQRHGVSEESLVEALVKGLTTATNAKGEPVEFKLIGVSELVAARDTARKAAISRVGENLPQARSVESNDQFVGNLNNLFSIEQVIGQRNQLFNDLLQKLEEVRSASDQIASSFDNTVRNIEGQVEKLRFSVISSAKTPLTQDQTTQLDAAAAVMREELISAANQLEPAGRALDDFKNRMELATQAVATLTNAQKTLLSDFLTSGQDLKSLLENFSQSITKDFVNMFLEFAMKPLQTQMLDNFKKIFRVQSAEDKAYAELNRASSVFYDAVTRFGAAVNAITSGPPGVGGPDLNANTSGLPYGIRIGDQVGYGAAPSKPSTVTRLPVISASEYDNLQSMLNTQGQATVEATLEQSFKGIGESLTSLGTVAETTGKQADGAAKQGEQGFGKFLGAMTGVATGALAITGAIQAMQDSQGGTYGTLMGIAGVLGGLGSIFGGISSLGKRAGGGPVSARRPYVVGEVGPELFIPDAGGKIVPNDKIAFTGAGGLTPELGGSPMASPFQQGGSSSVSNAFSTISSTAIPFTKSTERLVAERAERETVAAINNPKPLDVRFESQVINGVEYVTAEQHQKGMSEAAERGRALALSALQNSVKSRRQVGLA